MAIYNGRILMRKGNEADFDPSKLMSGEWAVSLDAGIVRICLEAGKVIRMATYEAFEKDMKQIEAILLECQSIEEAVRRINTEVSEKLNACAEYVQQAKEYSEQAKTSEANAKSYMQSAKTSEANAKTSETNAKASENSAKESENNAKLTEERAREVFESIPEDYSTISNDLYELAIKENASGEEIHVNDSSNLKLREFALYGKAKQNTTTGKNLLNARLNVDIKSNDVYKIYNVKPNTTYSLSLTQMAVALTTNSIAQHFYKCCDEADNVLKSNTIANMTFTSVGEVITKESTITTPENTSYIQLDLGTYYGSNSSTIKTLYAQLEDGNVATEYEQYTGGQPSPNPQYPQHIEVSGESYNLLENTATSRTVSGITFTVNEDKSITANGTATATAVVEFFTTLPKGTYITSGCPKNGTTDSYTIENKIKNSSGTGLGRDSGNGATYTLTEETLVDTYIRIASGYTANNLTFYPMIRKASVTNDRYMPYGVDRVEVKSVGNNLLYSTYTTRTINGVTITRNNDGTYTLNGTATSGTGVALVDNLGKDNNIYNTSPKGKYFCGNRKVSDNKLYQMTVYGMSGTELAVFYGNTETECVKIKETENIKYVYLWINANAVFNNIVLKPMITKDSTANYDSYQPYKETLATIPTENGLCGIKVSSNGNYTDQNGQQWICDEIVKYADGSGKRIHKIKKVVFDGVNLSFNTKSSSTKNNIFIADNKTRDLKKPPTNSDYANFVSSHFIIDTNNGTNGHGYSNPKPCMYGDYRYPNIYFGFGIDSEITTIELANEWLKTNNVTAYYELETPIETPLTAEEIAEIEKLHTFYPVTNISNDFDCGMSVTYYCDSKNYIGNQLAIMKQEQEEAMMNMLLLMPTEVQATMIENDTNDLLKESEI